MSESMLEAIQQERAEWLTRKGIAEIRAQLSGLPDCGAVDYSLGDWVTIGDAESLDESIRAQAIELARQLKPWRKGPFRLFGEAIDSEWCSHIKYNAIESFIAIEGKTVADVGCNNGYYLLRMLEKNPATLIGFDPSPLFLTQFELLNHFMKTPIRYELLGVEHLPLYPHPFDFILCLGVLYHRPDPVAMLKQIAQSLTQDGMLLLDTLTIPGEEPHALVPKERYAKMRNVYFIPTLSALENWLYRARLEVVEWIDTIPTTLQEQRKTDWIDGESLDSFVDFAHNVTIEGYPPPQRTYVTVRRM